LQGRIRIGVSTLPSAVEIHVDDNGKGVGADIVDHVFDPFFTTRLADGYSGLGLHVAHSIVHGLLGGTIMLDRSVAEGTRVSMRIPSVAPQGQVEHEDDLR
jgi:signal transduction histidine kinase